MNFRQLEIFKTVMEAGSTIAAAAQLGLSQSAISRQLTGLETMVGRELFLRDKGRLVPRPEAHLLLREIGEVSGSLARLRGCINDIRSGVLSEGLVRVAFPHSLAATMLPPILARFHATYPRVTVEVLSGPYDAIERKLHDRIADIGFVRLPTELPGFVTHSQLTSGTSCVMRRDHPLAGAAAVGLRDLAQHELILLGRQRLNRNELEHDLERQVPDYRCSLEVHSVETACACAAEGLGLAIVPSFIVEHFRDDRLAVVPFRPDRLSDYGIVTLSGAALPWAAEAFVQAVGLAPLPRDG